MRGSATEGVLYGGKDPAWDDVIPEAPWLVGVDGGGEGVVVVVVVVVVVGSFLKSMQNIKSVVSMRKRSEKQHMPVMTIRTTTGSVTSSTQGLRNLHLSSRIMGSSASKTFYT